MNPSTDEQPLEERGEPRHTHEAAHEPHEPVEERANRWLEEARHVIDEQARRHPYQTVLAAAGIGYVLGGGIPSWVLRAAVNAGGRVMLARALGPALGAALGNARNHGGDMTFRYPNDSYSSNWFGRNQSNVSPFDGNLLPSLMLFGTGIVVGAGVALMLAPKPGRELRADIGRGAGKLGQTVRQAMPGRQGEETRVPVGHHSSSSSSRI